MNSLLPIRAPAATVLLLFTACSSADNPAPAPTTPASVADAASPDSPTIWVSRSGTVDPTALPLRDQGYVTDGPKKGYVLACDPRMFQQTGGPGASGAGPWVNAAAGTYDVTKKVFVQGNIVFPNATFAVGIAGERRTISGNSLPFGVPAGAFPVATSDPAYAFDRNPNEIVAQDLNFSIPRNPTPASGAACIYKEVGITLDGVPLHGPLDSIGRDEMAYQLQDACSGASQPGGGYHRHALSDCTPHIHDKNALVGYALDGFGIFSPYDENGKELTTADLDECHGITSNVVWEGATVSMYHYVLTRDFPYSIGCFKGSPTRNAFPALPGAPPEH